MAPKVSVVVNCYNGETHLKETLDSVYAQSLDDWEIVFWDNASTDRTSEVVQQYDSRLRYFRSEEHTALSHARNAAFAQAQGDYIAILDADDIWRVDKLEQQVNLLDSDRQLGMVFSDSMFFDAQGDHWRMFQLIKPSRGHVFGDLLVRNFISSETMMYRSAALAELEYVFDERFTRVMDYDLSLRVAYRHPVDYVDEPLSKWRMAQESKAWNDWKNSLVPRVIELKALSEQFSESYPDIASKYPKELRLFYRQLDYSFGLDLWRRGFAGEARRYLARHPTYGKSSLVYLCSLFMSYQRLNAVKNAIRARSLRPQ